RRRGSAGPGRTGGRSTGRRGRTGATRRTRRSGLVDRATAQQLAHLVRVEEAGDAEELLLIDAQLTTELIAVVDHPVERRLRRERAVLVLLSVGIVLAALRLLQQRLLCG